jgi:hypothetical protein
MRQAELDAIERTWCDAARVRTHWQGCQVAHDHVACAVQLLVDEVRKLRAFVLENTTVEVRGERMVAEWARSLLDE